VLGLENAMSTISIKGDFSETALSLLTNALGREKRIVADSLRTARDKVNALAKMLSVDVEKLMRGEIEHVESKDMQLIELEGEVELLMQFETELKELESFEICR